LLLQQTTVLSQPIELLPIWLQECPALELPEAMEVQQNGLPDWQTLAWAYVKK
jgi:hypothetical protein